MSNSAFFYVDGIPTKGLWFEIDNLSDTDDVLKMLADAGLIPTDEDGDPEYGGDLLVADTMGDLARAFYSSTSDTLDLAGLVEVLEFCERNTVDEGAVAAYLNDRHTWSQSDFEEACCGQYDSEVAYVEELVEECGILSEMPESLRCYFDCAAYARDLFINDYTFTKGYVFRRN
jgi:hypothetical protein